MGEGGLGSFQWTLSGGRGSGEFPVNVKWGKRVWGVSSGR